MTELMLQLVQQLKMMVIATGGMMAAPAALPVTGPPVQDVQVVQAPQVVQVPQPDLLPAGCDRWCALVAQAYGASERGDMVEVIRLASEAYNVTHLFGWAVGTARCESGLNPKAHSGYYEGLFQHDPYYWPARAAAAGFPGTSPFDPVANAFTTLSMRAAGAGAQHWPVCGR